MGPAPSALLPMHELINALGAWRADRGSQSRVALAAALERIVETTGVAGARIAFGTPDEPADAVGAGTLRDDAGTSARTDVWLGPGDDARAVIWVDAAPEPRRTLASTLEVALDAVVSRQEAHVQRQQLEALDAAVRGIAGVLSVDRVLQLIVDRVRDLVAAEYAAVGIVGRFGNIEQFITSGMSDEVRAQIGPLPRGHGLLGLIIEEDRSFLIDDIGLDHRRHGFPAHHPEMHAFLGAPVRSKGQTIGNLYLTNKLTAPTFSETDLRLIEMFALHAGIAMENARLHEEVQRLAVVEERERISQDLHDSIIQSLYAISLSLEDVPDVLAEDATEGAARIDRAIDGIHSTIRDIRNFISGLQPELLDDADLGTSLEILAREFRANTVVDLQLALSGEPVRVPDEKAAHLLAIARESLSNIVRHAAATRASLELAVMDRSARMTIRDNGSGFDTRRARSGAQHGVTNMAARAHAAGGSLTVRSEIGVGTNIEIEIPLSEDE